MYVPHWKQIESATIYFHIISGFLNVLQCQRRLSVICMHFFQSKWPILGLFRGLLEGISELETNFTENTEEFTTKYHISKLSSNFKTTKAHSCKSRHIIYSPMKYKHVRLFL
jgi:hypothetical protein